MDEQILGTLGELERKLVELQRTIATLEHAEEAATAASAELAATSASAEPAATDTREEPTNAAPRWEPPPVASRERPSDVASRERPADMAPRERPSDVAPRERPSDVAPRERASDVAPREPSADTAPRERSADMAPHASRLVDESLPAAGARAMREPAPSGTYAPPAAVGARAIAPDDLIRFRDRLERAARELTNDYNDLLARLSEPAPSPATPGSSISFARGAPSLDIIDVHGLRDAAVRALESDPGGATAYGTSVGYPRLRSWIADRHGVEPERVFVTNGSMQADAFLFQHLVHAGEDVVVESPTYDRTLLSLRGRGARVHAIALEEDGIDTRTLARELRGGRLLPRLAHIIPNFQNPAGYTLSLEKRQELLALAAEYGFVLFEDDPYVALRFRGESLPTMLSMDPDRVVYASSFSKTVCPGVRVGYLVGTTALIEAVSDIARDTYISPSMISQAIVYEFCASGAIERSIETVREALRERADALAYALRRELPEARFRPPDGGYFMWVTLPPGTNVAALADAAAELGVSFVKGTDFMLEGGESSLRLAFAGVTPKQIDDGVTRLAAAYRSVA